MNFWTTTTDVGELSSDAVVIATGKDTQPVMPRWPGWESFSGRFLHARDYRNADAFAGLDVLVVGAGNSGVDIALDALRSGAKRIQMAIRTLPHIVPRDIGGVPFDLIALVTRLAPLCAQDASAKLLRRLALGDLSAYGLAIPADGPTERLLRAMSIPIVERGDFCDAVRRKTIEIVPAVRELRGDRVVLVDGSRHRADVLIAATGYRPGLEQLVGHLGVLDGTGLPTHPGYRRHPTVPLIRFVGFVESATGLLREIRLEARESAKSLTVEIQARKPLLGPPQSTEKGARSCSETR